MGIKGAKKVTAKKAVKQSFLTNWRTTLAGLITGAALGYAGYSTGNPELIIAGATAAAGGIIGKDSTVSGTGDDEE